MHTYNSINKNNKIKQKMLIYVNFQTRDSNHQTRNTIYIYMKKQ